MWATPISARRSRPSISRPPTRTSSARTRFFNLGAFVRKDALQLLSQRQSSCRPWAREPANLFHLPVPHADQRRRFTPITPMSKGINNIKAGVAVRSRPSCASTTAWASSINLYNSPCMDVNGNPLPGYDSQFDCDGETSFPNGNYNPVLAPYDLTRGGSDYYNFFHTDVKELALYIEDQIKAGNWVFNLGMRGDIYNGLAIGRQPEPRVGIAYNVKPSATVSGCLLRAHPGDALQRKPRALQHWMRRTRSLIPCSAAIQASKERSSRVSATSSMPVCSRPSANTSWSAASTSGSTPTTALTSASWAIRPSPSPSTGTTPRSPATRCTPKFPRLPRLQRLFRHFLGGCALLRAPGGRSRGHQRSRCRAQYPFRIDHDEKFNETTHLQYTVSSRWQLGERTVGRL